MFRMMGVALVVATAPAFSSAAGQPCRMAVSPNEVAWAKLPGAPEVVQPLPVWARAFAGWQPATAARMLELDALHRTGDRLDARLRAVARYSAAQANRCSYAQEFAAADYDRAVGHPSRLGELLKSPESLAEVDRLVAAFSRQMMRDAAGVTDAEVARLIGLLGEERVVALVALLAHASFQDRVLLTLAVSAEPGGALAPVATRFGELPPAPKYAMPPPKDAAPPRPASVAGATERFLSTRAGLTQQKERPGRIRVPSAEAATARMGSDDSARWQNGIVWSRVCFGYQPELTSAWFACGSAFRREGSLDPGFTNAIFWVVTDSLNCFY